MFTVNFQTNNSGVEHSNQIFDSLLNAFNFMHSQVYTKNYVYGVVIDSDGEIVDRLYNLDNIHGF
jgi:hypothetical protein